MRALRDARTRELRASQRRPLVPLRGPLLAFAALLGGSACTGGEPGDASASSTGTATTAASTSATASTGDASASASSDSGASTDATDATSDATTGTSSATTTTASSGSASATTTTTSTSGDATTDDTTTDDTTTGGTLTRCPTIAKGTIAATVTAPPIDEASGMVASRSQPGVLWVHNDSGDDPRFFAVDGSGALLGTFNVPKAQAVDWEDMAIGPGGAPDDGTTWLYFGDIGDNAEKRDSIAVYRVPEPVAAEAKGGELDVAGVEAITLTYPDGAHNAETLLVDPDDGELVIVTKGDDTAVYHLPGPIAAGTYELAQFEPINVPLSVTTGGDVSPLGDFVIVRTYIDAKLWLRAPGTGLAEAFAGEPCSVPLALEIQGETLAIAGDGGGYFTLSEMVKQPLWWFARE